MFFDEITSIEILKDARRLVGLLVDKWQWSDKRLYEACKCICQAYEAYAEYKSNPKKETN